MIKSVWDPERAAMGAKMASLRTAWNSAGAAVRQDHFVRTWVNLERRLEQAKEGIRMELWEVGLLVKSVVF